MADPWSIRQTLHTDTLSAQPPCLPAEGRREGGWCCGMGEHTLSLITTAAKAWLLHPEPRQGWRTCSVGAANLSVWGSVRVRRPDQTLLPLNLHPSTVMKHLENQYLTVYKEAGLIEGVTEEHNLSKQILARSYGSTFWEIHFFTFLQTVRWEGWHYTDMCPCCYTKLS